MKSVEFNGFFTHIIFKSDDNYTVAEFCTNEKYEKYMVVVGYIGEVYEDCEYRISGEFKEHPKYGQQLQLFSYEKILANDVDSLVRYFSSSLFKGIGNKAAINIVKQLGNNAIELIKKDDSIIDQINGLSEKQRVALREGIEKGLDDSIVFLTQNGLNTKSILKIQAIYEDKAVEIIKANPYQLINDIDGIGFKTADRLGKNLGFEDNHPFRIKAAIVACVLNLCVSNGDSFVSIDKVFKYMSKNFNFNDEKLFDQYLNELKLERLIYIEGNDIYHITQYDAEKGIADFFRMFTIDNHSLIKTNVLNDKIVALEKDINIEYDQKQLSAINTFFNEPFSILTGGPGTGKTTIVRAIISLYQELYPNNQIALCAPTGRAAKRLTQLSNYGATTIHSLLKWDLESNKFGVNAENPIDANLLIIDEFSMVDSWLFYNLLLAASSIDKILVIGDEDQLPSVGPGFVLKDLIHADIFPITKLDKIYRQKDGSDVITLAYDIRHNNCDVLDISEDVKFFNCPNYEVKKQIVKIVDNAYSKGYTDMDIQVLAPMYKGVAGINELNKALRDYCNPHSDELKELMVGMFLFRENDKVLQLKNQPDDNVFNGDIGKIIEISKANENIDNEDKIIVEFDDITVEYNNDNFNNLTHAYCISIHKSQGSEYPIVIMPILRDYAFMLQRRLIYTGVTRAKNSLVLLGDKEQLLKGINRNEFQPRNTKLTQRLIEKLK